MGPLVRASRGLQVGARVATTGASAAGGALAGGNRLELAVPQTLDTIDVARCFCAAGRVLGLVGGAAAGCADANWRVCVNAPGVLTLGLGLWFTSAVVVRHGQSEGEDATAGPRDLGECAPDPECATLVVWLDPAVCAMPQHSSAADGRLARRRAAALTAERFQVRMPSGRSIGVRHGTGLVLPASPNACREWRSLAVVDAHGVGGGGGNGGVGMDVDCFGCQLVEVRFFVCSGVRQLCSRLGDTGVHAALAS